MNVRRLEAEAIRDALLSLSGRLVRPCTAPACRCTSRPSWTAAAGPAHSGPLDGDGRRSVYLGVRRNFLNPMFLAFDTPVPFSCMGRRNASNVPAQALILLNDPLVIEQATAVGRPAPPRTGPRRPRSARAALRSRPSAARRPRTRPGPACDFLGRPGWADLCHVLDQYERVYFYRLRSDLGDSSRFRT